ncbi:MAG: response regulator [Gammaproteobacteria bacterium]|nr:response regulator [Gammaproteobacteria bacterium]
MNEQENITGKLNKYAEKLDATILFVDDEANILSSLKRLFRPVIENIVVAESGAEALDVLKLAKVDVVVSDMRMPEMDGAEFLAQVADKYPDTVRILLTGYSDITSTIEAVNKGSIYRYISKPWEDNDIILTVKHAIQGKFLEKEKNRLQALTESQNRELKELNLNLEERVKVRTEEVRQTMAQLQVAHTSLKKNYVTTIKVFSNIIELREGGDNSLTRNVTDLAQKIAKKIGVSDDDIQQVIFASLLRNIGKIGFPDELNRKPFNSLSYEDKKKMLKHPVIGQGILMSLDYLQKASVLIRHQYEQYDGQGYPDKLQGKNIPLGARIISLANDYYAQQFGILSSHRLSANETLEYIKRNKGVRYDSILVDALFEILGVTDSLTHEVKEEKVKELKLNTLKLIEGMVLSRDLSLKNGVVLLAKGQILDKNLILRVRKMENSVNEKIDVYVLS